MSKHAFLTAVVALVALGLSGSVLAIQQHSLASPAPSQANSPTFQAPLQLDYYVTLRMADSANVSWQNVPIGTSNGAVLSGTAYNYFWGSKHVVQVDLVLTFPGTTTFTEILNSIAITTCPEIRPPYTPFAKDSIFTYTENLNRKDQLKFRVTLDHPTGSAAGMYSVNIKIYGNYE